MNNQTQDSITSAILLVGGLGTRLHPLTFQTPKPMLHVAGIPFTEHQIAKARAAGITEIVLATSYLSDVFEPHFGDGEKFGIKISYAVEKSPLGTGGAIANAAQKLTSNGPVVIFNGDVLSSHDLLAQMQMHQSLGADATLYLTQVEDARAFGVVEMSANTIISFNEKMENPPTNIINAGCYIFNREIINQIPTGRSVSVERETFPQILSQGKTVAGYLDNSYWIDIGTPEAILKVTGDLISGAAQSDAFDEILSSQEFDIKGGSLIAHSAHIDPLAIIEEGCFIAPRAHVGPGARLNRSIIEHSATIGRSVSLSSTFVAPFTEVPAGFVAENQFFGY